MQVINTKQFLTQENRIPKGVRLMDRPRRKGEEKTPRCVCTSYEKNLHLGFAYILHKTWSSRHNVGGLHPLGRSAMESPRGFRNLLLFPCFV